ncbi:MAG: DUF6531 domain-containing protein, partial [Methylocella sp.]
MLRMVLVAWLVGGAASEAWAQTTSTFFYNSGPIALSGGNPPSCPATATITGTMIVANTFPPNYTGPVPAIGYNFAAGGFNFTPSNSNGIGGTQILLSGGQLINAGAHIGSNILAPCCPGHNLHYISFAIDLPPAFSPDEDVVIQNLQNPNCFYEQQSVTSGFSWSGAISFASPKTLGLTSAPVDPENLPSSPANPTSNLRCGSANPTDPAVSCQVGDPINAATGNKLQTETDFAGAANTGLSLVRYYNSQDTSATAFGTLWRSPWHRGLRVSGNTVTVTRADGRQDIFTNKSGVYSSDPDVTSVLTAVSSGGVVTSYRLVTASDVTETYAPSGQLLSVTTRSGLTTTLTYGASGNLRKVTGPFGHVLSFTANSNGNVATMTAPDGGVYTYAYDTFGNLISVTHPDKTVRQHVYGNAAFPNFLTGIIDEKGNRFATWAYDSQGRAISSQHAGGADLTTVSYATNASTVTDARGNVHGYSLITQFGVVKPAAITGAPVQSAGGKAFTYDANSFVASRTDFDGNITTYIHDARGDEISRTEASGTPLARTISTTWLSTFHSPTLITEPNRTTDFTYDAHGNLLTKTITASAAVRSFSYTYNAFGQVLTATDPRGNVTNYAYDAKGDLTSTTDALGHVTSITSYDANGRPLTIVDPNGVPTALTYGPRGRLTSRTVGTLKTAYAYNRVGNLIRVTQPDGSYLTYSYDPAHRLIGIADAAGDHIVYTLDATSNRITEQAFDSSGMLSRTQSYTYNVVNRLKKAIGAEGQTTTYAYDA